VSSIYSEPSSRPSNLHLPSPPLSTVQFCVVIINKCCCFWLSPSTFPSAL